jgi:AcrR family transcriptional regulator
LTSTIATEKTESRREARARRKAEEILTAAREVFMECGFGDATTDAIQARAGVSKSTLYAYFPTKEHLFEAVCRLKSESFEAMLRNAVTDETEPRRFLTRFGTEFLTYLFSEEGLAFFRLMIAESGRFPHLGKVFYDAGVAASSAMVERFLAGAHQEGLLDVEWPALSAEHFMGMLKSDIHLRVLLNVGKPLTPEQVSRYVEQTVDRFIRAHRREGRAAD